ncbi:hypothetical protein ACVILK_007626 [Bradyrhizobium embrapense]
MINQGKPSTPSGSPAKSQTKATDHELQKHDIFTRYGQLPGRPVGYCAWGCFRYLAARGHGPRNGAACPYPGMNPNAFSNRLA